MPGPRVMRCTECKREKKRKQDTLSQEQKFQNMKKMKEQATAKIRYLKREVGSLKAQVMKTSHFLIFSTSILVYFYFILSID